MIQPISQSYLERVPVFQEMSESNLKKLVELAKTIEFQKNHIVVHAGETGDSMYVILEGELKVYQTDNHEKQIILAILKKGDFFGEMSLIDGKERSASIAAMEQSTLLRLGKKDFDVLTKESPSFSKNLLLGLCERLRVADSKISSLALMDVYGRIAKLLMECSEPYGEYHIVREHLTHQDIADRIGSSREMVSKILRDLSYGRYIFQDERKSIIITKHLPSAW